jgi:hypothetical protein
MLFEGGRIGALIWRMAVYIPNAQAAVDGTAGQNVLRGVKGEAGDGPSLARQGLDQFAFGASQTLIVPLTPPPASTRPAASKATLVISLRCHSKGALDLLTRRETGAEPESRLQCVAFLLRAAREKPLRNGFSVA